MQTKPNEQPQRPEPGIYHDVQFDQYVAWDAINHSTLKHGLRSMAHLKAAMEQPSEPTPAMRLGTLVHAAALEPLEMMKRYVALPRFEDQVRKPDGTEYASPKASKAYKDMVRDFRDEHPGKEIVTEDEFALLQGVLESLQRDDRARDWLWSPAKTEVSIVWDDRETGVRCKARLDKWCQIDATITDVKTTNDAQRFESQIAKLAYHQQLAMYAEGIRVVTGTDHTARIIAVEPKPPFGVRAAPLSDDAINWGAESFRRLLREYAECLARDDWPGYENPELWHLPSWATADAVNDDVLELVIGGEPVAVQ